MSEYKLGDTDLSDEKIDPIYKKGFEHGYWLKRGDCAELDDIIERNKKWNYGTGLKAGKREAMREQVRERSKHNNERSQDRDKGMEME